MHTAALLLLLVGAAAAGSVGKPNFVFVLTDDQDRILGEKGYSSLGSLESQPTLRKLMMEGGAFLENYLVNTPICCPSRTEFFTGRYFQNVRGEDGKGCMHANTTGVGLRGTGLFGLFTESGYNTGIFGKTTNDQEPQLKRIVEESSASYVDSPLDYNNFYGATYFRGFGNGTSYVETLDHDTPRFGTAYQTTQIGNRSLLWLEEALKDPRPFFMYLGPHAPHYPATPAPWYETLWDSVAAPVTPNYNLSSPGKAQHVRQNPPLTSVAKCWEDQHFRDRWASLRSVEEIVEEVYHRLDKAGVLDRTYIIYTSDHGYKLGQWRIGTSKQHPYETDIHVPFLIRGPGIPKGAVYSNMAGNVDLLPTLLDLAGMQIPSDVDGRSMARFLKGDRDVEWRDRFLHTYESVGTYYNDHSNCWSPDTYKKTCGGDMPRGPAGAVADCKEAEGVGEGNCYFVDSTHSNTWRALRVNNATHNWQYVEYDPTFTWQPPLQHYELYDINKDPYQTDNVYDSQTAQVKAALHTELVSYFACRGPSCP